MMSGIIYSSQYTGQQIEEVVRKVLDGDIGTGGTGANGITPHIGTNGNWWIGEEDTNVPATGPQGPAGANGIDGQDGAPGASGKDGANGITPHIGDNGNWYIGDTDTEVSAYGNTDYVPSYWTENLTAAVESTRRAMEFAGRNKSAFFFYTDSHYKPETGSGTISPVLLKYLHRNTPINKTVYGGDLVIQEADSIADMPYLYERMAAIRGLPNHHSVHGNHDDGNDVDNRYTSAEVYSFLMAPEETPDIVRGGDFYYYIDCPNECTRYLYLDTASYDDTVLYDAEQMQFVVDTLNATPENWHIIPIAHIWYVPNGSDYHNPVLSSAAQRLLPVFDAYNGKASGSVLIADNRDTNVTVTYDFTQATGKIEFCIGGHLHTDYDGSSTGGIPIIICMGDGNPARTGDPAIVFGTITEASVSAIIADYANKKVKIVRAGRGESREVILPEQETPVEPSEPETPTDPETPVNLLSTAKMTDGTTIKNGVGYQDGQYIRGGTGEQIGWGTDESYWASGIIEWDTTKELIIDGWNPDGQSRSRWRCTSGGYGGFVGITDNNGNSFFDSIPAYSVAAEESGFYSRWKFTQDPDKSDRFTVTPWNSELIAALDKLGNKIWFAISLPGSGANVSIYYGE